MGTSATRALTWIITSRSVVAGVHSGTTTLPNFSPLSSKNTSILTAVTLIATSAASFGGRMTASITPETLGCAAGVPGGAHGEGKVILISQQWIDEMRSEVCPPT